MRPGTGILMAALALAALPSSAPALKIRRSTYDDDLWAKPQEPYDAGKRAEKDVIALAKAEAKRQRRAAKRLGQKVGADDTALERPNATAQGPGGSSPGPAGAMGSAAG